MKERIFKEIECPNCKGIGEIPHYHYYCQGVCFRCLGNGKIKIEVTQDGFSVAGIKKKYDGFRRDVKKRSIESVRCIVQNTNYEMRQQLKDDGAKWESGYRYWYFLEGNDNINKYTTMKNINNLYYRRYYEKESDQDCFKVYQLNNWNGNHIASMINVDEKTIDKAIKWLFKNYVMDIDKCEVQK